VKLSAITLQEHVHGAVGRKSEELVGGRSEGLVVLVVIWC
jgi:hypothetical protein